MTTFQDILTALQDNIPKSKRKYSVWYTLEDNPDFSIRVTQPDPFDSYLDIIAKVTMFYKDTKRYEVLIAIDTDINAFVNKLMYKIERIKYYVKQSI